MRRFLFLLLAVLMTLVIALPAIADKPDKPGKPPTSVPIAVSMDAWPLWSHEGSDLIGYRVTLENKTSDDIPDVAVMFITSDPEAYPKAISGWDFPEDATDGVVPANSTVSENFYLYVHQFSEAAPCLAEDENTWPDECALLATAEVLINGDVATQTQMSTPLYPDPPCNFEVPNEDGEVSGDMTGGEVCIWKPTSTGKWTVSAVPNPIPTRPTRLMMSVRDGVPGNWCTVPDDPDSGVLQERWLPNRTETEPFILDVFLPGSDDFTDLADGQCWTGGAGVCFEDDCYFAVGNPESFYLYSSFDATITLTSTDA